MASETDSQGPTMGRAGPPLQPIDPAAIQILKRVCASGSDDDVANLVGIIGLSAAIIILSARLPAHAGLELIAIFRQVRPEWFEGAS